MVPFILYFFYFNIPGMNKDSQDFAGVLFDSLSLRANIKGELINKDQMYEFWNQISDQSFDSRLHTFFDM